MCAECDKAFSQDGNLLTHMKIHTKACDKRFIDRGCLEETQ